MRYKNIYMLMAALSLFSCTKEKGGQEPRSGEALTIEASIGALTKTSLQVEEKSAFSKGDQISIYAWTGSATEVPEKKIVDGVVNTFDGTKWTPATQMLWNYVKENHYFLGVYPAKAITNFTADEYTLGPDLLIATELEGIPFKENPDPVALTFTHAMAKLNVNMKFRNQWAGTPAVTSVVTTSKVGYTVNYLTKAVTATGTAVQAPVYEVSATEGYDRSFSGLQVPQEDVTTLTVTIDGKGYVYTGSIPLESGTLTTLNLYVGLDKIELGSVTVIPWVEKPLIEGGEAFIPVTGISFAQGTGGSLKVNKTLQLTPVLTPADATDGGECTWRSTDTSVATVSETGLVTALTPGTTTISCTCAGKTAQYALTVVNG